MKSEKRNNGSGSIGVKKASAKTSAKSERRKHHGSVAAAKSVAAIESGEKRKSGSENIIA